MFRLLGSGIEILNYDGGYPVVGRLGTSSYQYTFGFSGQTTLHTDVASKLYVTMCIYMYIYIYVFSAIFIFVPTL